jgi:hypothetical protein
MRGACIGSDLDVVFLRHDRNFELCISAPPLTRHMSRSDVPDPPKESWGVWRPQPSVAPASRRRIVSDCLVTCKHQRRFAGSFSQSSASWSQNALA